MGRFHLDKQIHALKKRVDETTDKNTRRVLMDRHNKLVKMRAGMETTEKGTGFHICGWCNTVITNCTCGQH